MGDNDGACVGEDDGFNISESFVLAILLAPIVQHNGNKLCMEELTSRGDCVGETYGVMNTPPRLD